MYYRYYEQLIEERSNDGKGEEVREGIGSIIRRERIKQGLKQINVCKGICSVSYYSRIERNEVKPDMKWLEPIFERLELPFTETYIVDHQEQETIIEQFFYHLAYESYEEMEYIIESKGDAYPLVHLLQLILKLKKKDIREAEEDLKAIYHYRKQLTNLELVVLLYGTSKYYFFMGDYHKAKKYLELTFRLKYNVTILEGFIHYLYAKTMSRLKQSIIALRHIHKAMASFADKCIYCFVIRVKIFIAVEIADSNPYLAIKQFKKMLRSKEIKDRPKYKAICQYYIACIYIRLNQYDKSLKLLEKISHSIHLNPMFGVAYVYLKVLMEEREQANKIFKKLKRKSYQSPRLKHILMYLQSLLNHHEGDEVIKILEEKLIPAAIEKHDENLEWEWRLMAIRLHEEQHSFQKANNHYRALIKKIKPSSII